ncbi:MAG: hypothetical protein KKB50_03005, partial [Planctomycetes bacterium]|nr:hypothetical protein [Planctomycetota bacterium]
GGGGGGRIAIVFDANTFAGVLSAHGGAAWQCGGAGTIFTKASGKATGELLLDNGGDAGAWTPFETPSVFDLSIGNAAVAYPLQPVTVSNLRILAGGRLTHARQADDFALTVQQDAVIDDGGYLLADGLGYAAQVGPGAGVAYSGYGSGAGYGGKGGDGYNHYSPGGAPYGFMEKPRDMGSGGGSGSGSSGGSGGGVLVVVVGGSFQVDGQVNANGNNGSGQNGGGGSGGSILIEADALAGAGFITAHGGNAGSAGVSGGGAGGRIAVFTCDLQMSMSQITASGGTGWEAGEAGTVFYGSNTIEFTLHPADQIVFFGEPVTFTAAATGQGGLTYQWRKDGVDLIDDGRITGATTTTLAIDPVEYDDNGYYYLVVTDDCGPFASEWARLIVPVPGDLNCDGEINGFDIDPFVLALLGPSYYDPVYPDCSYMLGDINGDGDVNGFDIDPFVDLLIGG